MTNNKISIRDRPPDLPEGYVPSGWTGKWQDLVNRLSWYLQRRVGLDKKYQAHNFTAMLTVAIEAAGAALLYATPSTSGILHWALLALCVPILPVALFLVVTTVLVTYEQE